MTPQEMVHEHNRGRVMGLLKAQAVTERELVAELTRAGKEIAERGMSDSAVYWRGYRDGLLQGRKQA